MSLYITLLLSSVVINSVTRSVLEHVGTHSMKGLGDKMGR